MGGGRGGGKGMGVGVSQCFTQKCNSTGVVDFHCNFSIRETVLL